VFEFEVTGHIFDYSAVNFVPPARAPDRFGLRSAGAVQRVTFDGQEVIEVGISPRHGGGPVYMTADHVAGYAPLMT
jgi:hypothetical protein